MYLKYFQHTWLHSFHVMHRVYSMAILAFLITLITIHWALGNSVMDRACGREESLSGPLLNSPQLWFEFVKRQSWPFVESLLSDSVWVDDAVPCWVCLLIWSYYSTLWPVAFASYLWNFLGQNYKDQKKVYHMSDAKSSHMFSILEENRNKTPCDKGVDFTVADDFRALLLVVWLLLHK